MTRGVAADRLGHPLAVDLERDGLLGEVARAPIGRSRAEAEAAVAPDIRELRQPRRRGPRLEPRFHQLDRGMDRVDGRAYLRLAIGLASGRQRAADPKGHLRLDAAQP